MRTDLLETDLYICMWKCFAFTSHWLKVRDSACYYDRLTWKCRCVDWGGCLGLTGNWSKGASGHMIWTFNAHSIRKTRNNQMQRPVNIRSLRVQTLQTLVNLRRFLSPLWLFLVHEKLYWKSILCRSLLREIPICDNLGSSPTLCTKFLFTYI
jgi:hypothetical protein